MAAEAGGRQEESHPLCSAPPRWCSRVCLLWSAAIVRIVPCGRRRHTAWPFSMVRRRKVWRMPRWQMPSNVKAGGSMLWCSCKRIVWRRSDGCGACVSCVRAAPRPPPPRGDAPHGACGIAWIAEWHQGVCMSVDAPWRGLVLRVVMPSSMVSRVLDMCRRARSDAGSAGVVSCRLVCQMHAHTSLSCFVSMDLFCCVSCMYRVGKGETSSPAR